MDDAHHLSTATSKEEGNHVADDGNVAGSEHAEPVDDTWKTADFLSLDMPGGDAAGGEDDGAEHSNDSNDDHRSKRRMEVASSIVPRYNTIMNKELPPWMEQHHELSGRFRVQPLVALHNEVVGFANLMNPLPEEKKERELLVERIKATAYAAFGADKCTLSVFGSQATGLFLPSSDIDLVIFLNKEQEATSKEHQDPKAKEKEEMEAWDSQDTGGGSPLHRFADTLMKQWKEDLSYLEVIEQTRVPLVKFTDSKTNISVDVSFDSDSGPKSATLMEKFMEAMPPLRPLTFVLKYFLAARGINEPYSGGVGSFMLQMMIVSFLQHREREAYMRRRGSVYNLGVLLLEFFELYGIDFNYITAGISVRYDGFYFPKGAKDRKEVFWQTSRPFSMALENPFDINADVGRATFRMQGIQRSFEVAFNVLRAHVSEPLVPAVSILASILPPTDEMKERRDIVRAAQPSMKSDTSLSRNSSTGSRDQYRSNKRHRSR